jgi:hypothetical protein
MASGKKKGPTLQRGKKRVAAVKGVFRGVELRSQLEILFATELEKRQIKWVYEPERIGPGRYLVDFYLPDLKCWVEVKGKFEPRDSLLLPNVAINLKRYRGERLFLYMRNKAYTVGSKTFTPLSHEEFWSEVVNPAGS